MKIFDFDEQLKEGQEHEEFLDMVFSRHVAVEPVSMEYQRKGVDRVFTNKDGAVRFVEYKADRKATITGNAFIETVSVSSTGAEGWAKKTIADVIIYFLPQEMKAYVINAQKMKKMIPEWSKQYRTGRAQNDGYYSEGLLIPLTELEKFGIIMNI